MELRHLEQVLEVCRAGGFSGAARKLRISQPTLSKSIARLEAQLSLRLFERSGGAARPTAYGSFVAQRAEALLKGASSLAHDLEQLARGEEGRVRIAVGAVTRLKPLPQFLRLVAERYPRLRVETVLANGPRMMRALQEGKADFAFAYSQHATRYGELIRKKLFEHPIVFVARAGHPALAMERGGPSDLLDYPLASTGVMPGLERWAGELGRFRQENLSAFVSDDYGLIIQRMLGTDALGIGPSFIFEEEIRAGRLAVVSSTFDATYVCWMITTPERWNAPLLKGMAELAKLAVVQPPRAAAG